MTRSRWELGNLKFRLSLIVLIVALVGVLSGVAISSLTGELNLAAAMVGFIACLLAAILGHLLNEFPHGNEFMMTRVMSSMMVRAGIPLVVVLCCKFIFPDTFSRGFIYFVVLLYLVGLISDAFFTLGRLKAEIADETTASSQSNDHK